MQIFSEDEKGCSQTTVILKRVSLYDGALDMLLPEDMEEMAEAWREVYYPYKERPEIIWWRPDGRVQMTFQRFACSLPREKVYAAAIAVSHLVQNHHPRIRAGCVHLFFENVAIGWFIMELNKGERKKKHMKFIMGLDGKFTLGTLTYPVEEQEKWTVIIKHLFWSIDGHLKGL